MASGVSVISSMEPPAAATTRVTSRRRPLHTCGVSILAVVHKAYRKAQDFNGPIGSMTKRIAILVTSSFPFIHAIQCQGLAILSFVDDHILVVANMIETIFPRSTCLFNQIDNLVYAAEGLPRKFDDAVNKFPMIIQKIPCLNWAVVHLLSWLNFLISTLTGCGSNNANERDIVIDINCNSLNNESEESYQCEDMEEPSLISDSFQDESKAVEAKYPVNLKSHLSDPLKDEAKTVGGLHAGSITSAPDENDEASSPKSGGIKCSYKEILEKGTKENMEKKEGRVMEESPKAIEEVGDGNKSNEDIVLEDPILELFEASWHMNPGKTVNGCPLPR